MKVISTNYTSVWEGGVEVTTDCKLLPELRIVFDIESADVNGLEILHEEYVDMPDGTQAKGLDFDNFRDLWVEQETDCDNKPDEEKLIDSLYEADDFEEMFNVIRLWNSQGNNIERIAAFLKKNNACLYLDDEPNLD